MARLLVGSEGTLALFTEATLRTVPLPEGRSLVLAQLRQSGGGPAAARKILESGPAACDLLDRRLLGLIRANEAVAAGPAWCRRRRKRCCWSSSKTAAPRHAGTPPRIWSPPMSQLDRTCCMPCAAVDDADLARISQLRDAALPSLYGQKTGAQPLPFIEDIGVPLDCMPEFMRRAQELLQEQETTASFLIHACTGQIHTRPFLDLQRSEDVSKLIAMAENFHALALELGGTVSTQHGTGLARTPWVARQAGPLYPLMRQLKAIFDPKNIFNPGKIVDPEPSLAVLAAADADAGQLVECAQARRQAKRNWPRRFEAVSPANLTADATLQLQWRPDEPRLESNHCNGCGQCRSEAPALRMCPLFRAMHAESATPRAKANLRAPSAAAAQSGAGPGLRRGAGRGRSVRQLQDVRPGVSGPCQYSQAHARDQGGQRRRAWPGPDALVLLPAWKPGPRSAAFPAADEPGPADACRCAGSWTRSSACRAAAVCRPWPAPRSSSKRPSRAGPRGPDAVPRSRASPCSSTLFGNYFDPLLAESAVAVLRHNGFDVSCRRDRPAAAWRPWPRATSRPPSS